MLDMKGVREVQNENLIQQKMQTATSIEHGLYVHHEGYKEPIFVPDSAFLRLPQVLQLIPVGKSTWWRGVASGRFPQGTKLGHNTTLWRVSAIRELLSQILTNGVNL
jgi:prophage regulatory protein